MSTSCLRWRWQVLKDGIWYYISLLRNEYLHCQISRRHSVLYSSSGFLQGQRCFNLRAKKIFNVSVYLRQYFKTIGGILNQTKLCVVVVKTSFIWESKDEPLWKGALSYFIITWVKCHSLDLPDLLMGRQSIKDPLPWMGNVWGKRLQYGTAIFKTIPLRQWYGM